MVFRAGGQHLLLFLLPFASFSELFFCKTGHFVPVLPFANRVELCPALFCRCPILAFQRTACISAIAWAVFLKWMLCMPSRCAASTLHSLLSTKTASSGCTPN